MTHSDPPVRPRLPTIARPEERNSGPPHCLQQRAGHTVEGGVLSRTRSVRPTYHNEDRASRLSVVRERPRRRPCASASGIAIEIPLHAYLTSRCGVGHPEDGVEPSMGALRDLVFMAHTAAPFSFVSPSMDAYRLLLVSPTSFSTSLLPLRLLLRQLCRDSSSPASSYSALVSSSTSAH